MLHFLFWTLVVGLDIWAVYNVWKNTKSDGVKIGWALGIFIFPIVGEELGLRFSLLVIFLFLIIIICGMTIALHARDRFGLLLASGIVSLIAFQAAINIGVVTSLLPNKGLPLPFVSYGGTAMVTLGLALGILMSTARSRGLMQR